MVTGIGLHWKSGVLFPSGMFITYCVIITPGVLDLLRMAAKSQKTKQKQQEQNTASFDYEHGKVLYNTKINQVH